MDTNVFDESGWMYLLYSQSVTRSQTLQQLDIIQLMLSYDDEILHGMNLIIKLVNKQFCLSFIRQEFEGLQDVMRCRVAEHIGKLDSQMNQNYSYCIFSHEIKMHDFFFYMCAFSCPIFSPLNMSIDLPGARWLWPIFRIYEGGMGHLLVFIWIQVHYIHNAFTDLEFSNITIFDHKMCF